MVVTVDLCMYYYLFKGHEKYYKHIVFKTAGSEYTYIFNFASFRDYHFNKKLTTDLFFKNKYIPCPPKNQLNDLSRRLRFKWS